MRVPGPRGPAKLRLLRRLQGPHIVDVVAALWREYGDTVLVTLPFGRPLYFVYDPGDVMLVLQRQARQFVKGSALDVFRTLIGDGVATADQDLWIRHRRQVQPSFHRRGLGRYAPATLQATVEHRRRWCAAGAGFQDFNRLLPRLAQDVVARAVLGADLGDALEPLQQAWDGAMAFVLRRTNAVLRPPLAWPLPSHRRFAAARRQIRDCVAGLIAAQAGGGVADPDSFLTRLAAGTGDRERLVDQVLNILFAGHETTGNGLASALYLILSHPPVHRRVVAELALVLGGAPPSPGALAALVYLRRVVHEALRLYPPVSLFVREALGPVDLSAATVPKGAVIILSPFVIHRRPDLWAAPERFDPDRFIDPAAALPPRFLAFGAGGRTCLGDEFAINTMVLILAELLQSLHLTLDRSRPIGIGFSGTLRPEPLHIRAAEKTAAEPQSSPQPVANPIEYIRYPN